MRGTGLREAADDVVRYETKCEMRSGRPRRTHGGVTEAVAPGRLHLGRLHRVREREPKLEDERECGHRDTDKSGSALP